MKTILFVLLLSYPVFADSSPILDPSYGLLSCSEDIVRGQFVVDGDLGLIGVSGGCPDIQFTPGEPTQISWEADFFSQVSDLVGPGQVLSFESPDPQFSATVKITTILPPDGNHVFGWTIFGVGVSSQITGSYCIDLICQEFSRSGSGMGEFIFANGNLEIAEVGLFEVPEPSSFWLLVGAAYWAFLVLRRLRRY